MRKDIFQRKSNDERCATKDQQNQQKKNDWKCVLHLIFVADSNIHLIFS